MSDPWCKILAMRLTRWSSDRMFVSYCQYYLQGREFLDKYFDTDTVARIFEGNSLAAGGPEHLTVQAGTHTGWIRLTTEQLAEAPPPPGEGWETAVDVSVLSTSGDLALVQWGGDWVQEAGNFATMGPGWYRVRVQTRGRDDGNDGAGEEDSVVEEHYVAVWPAPPQPDRVHRATDAFARAHYDPQRPPGQPITLEDAPDSLFEDPYVQTPRPIPGSPVVEQIRFGAVPDQPSAD
jgi:hypothetical protein